MTLDERTLMKSIRALIPGFVKNELKTSLRDVVRRSLEEQASGWAADRVELQALRAKTAELEAQVGQLETILRRESVCPPPPPKHLQVRVVGAYVPGFLESGYSICDDLDAALSSAGRTLLDFGRILDWGCGSGRTTRALRTRLPSAELHGTDIDPEAIAWLIQNAPRVAEFRVAPHRPPTSYEDATFDFVFGISIFTHLPESMQFEWLAELRRLTRPGGYLVMTTSGEQNYSQLPPELRTIVETRGFHYIDGGYGQSISLPAFYQNTFHTHEYIRREWSRDFEILDIQAGRLQRHQDMVLMRRRD